jgi:glutamyl-tRNA reductase
VEVRETLSFNSEEAAALLRGAASDTPGLEAAILSTCNRTEFYLASPEGSDPVEAWLQRLRGLRPNVPILRQDCPLIRLTGATAARHLFRVACGLDSAILGDAQILRQVKDTLSLAGESGSLGNWLHHTFDQALRAGRRARAETGIGRGAASIGSALAGMLAERFDGKSPHILIIGAGEAARNIGWHVAKRRLGRITFVNRTEERASELARHCGGEVLPWSSLRGALAYAEVVVSATSAPHPILKREMLEEIATLRLGRFPVVVDAGVPRNVEAGSCIPVIDVDAIRERQAKGLAERREAVPAVEAIVEEETLLWEQWRASLPLEAVIKALFQEVSAHSQEAAGHLASRGGLTHDHAERVVTRSFKRLLHRHVRRLRDLPTRHSADSFFHTLGSTRI